jgi:hypothetical protein
VAFRSSIGERARRDAASPSKNIFPGQSSVTSDFPKIWSHSPTTSPSFQASVNRSERTFANPRGFTFGAEVGRERLTLSKQAPLPAVIAPTPICKIIFALEPTSHFQVEVLPPLQLTQAPHMMLTSAHVAYNTGLFSHLGEHDAIYLYYSAHFFPAANLNLFLAIATWNMSVTARASKDSFTVYHFFLRCIPKFACASPLQPVRGLNLLQINHTARFVQTRFRSMDMNEARKSTAACRSQSIILLQ